MKIIRTRKKLIQRFLASVTVLLLLTGMISPALIFAADLFPFDEFKSDEEDYPLKYINVYASDKGAPGNDEDYEYFEEDFKGYENSYDYLKSANLINDGTIYYRGYSNLGKTDEYLLYSQNADVKVAQPGDFSDIGDEGGELYIDKDEASGIKVGTMPDL